MLVSNQYWELMLNLMTMIHIPIMGHDAFIATVSDSAAILSSVLLATPLHVGTDFTVDHGCFSKWTVRCRHGSICMYFYLL